MKDPNWCYKDMKSKYEHEVPKHINHTTKICSKFHEV
jgi:hypothetical protein